MDAADESVSNSIMIALLPTTAEWCRFALPHMTLVYGGDKSKRKPQEFNDIAKDASMLSMLSRQISVRVIGKEVFGPPEEQVDVFRLEATSEVLALRRTVERWNASEFPFNPHVTIGPVGSFIEEVPRYIIFNRIMVGWGDESLIFWLKQ